MTTIRVSVLVPYYKASDFIARCARAIFEQTYQNIEYVFVDDCSPDNSIGILENVLLEYPQRKEQVIIIKHERNKGVSAARNTALRNSSGEFAIFVDSDDDMPRDAVEKLVKKHGLSKITKALNNLQVWNKNDDKELSKWAGNMIDKLTKKFGKNESLYDYYDMPSSAFNIYDDIPDEPFTEEDEFNYYVDYVYNHTRNPQEAARYLRSEGKSKEYIDQVIAAVDEIYG